MSTRFCDDLCEFVLIHAQAKFDFVDSGLTQGIKNKIKFELLPHGLKQNYGYKHIGKSHLPLRIHTFKWITKYMSNAVNEHDETARRHQNRLILRNMQNPKWSYYHTSAHGLADLVNCDHIPK